MFELKTDSNLVHQLNARGEVLFNEQKNAVYKRTDKLFAWLLYAQWLAGILVACISSPRTWTGAESAVHIHIWTSIFLGALIIARPIYLIYMKPGETVTRHTVAIAQMLYSALFIHLTGGRIETHFHIFGSLAFLSFYRDWRVLITASLVVVADHILRGLYFPMSIYGVNAIEPLRWLEHTWWVVFEDFFLIKCCQANVAEMHAIAARQAEVELTRDNVEELVRQRTMELQQSEQKLAGQLVENTQLANIVEWAGDAIIGQTLDGIITSWNNGARVLFGYTADEIKGKHISILTPAARAAEMEELMSADRLKQSRADLETQRLRKDGQELAVSLSRSPVFNSKDEIIGICEVMHNISDRKEAERRVSEFYSIVSHELRTPLTSVRGALGLMENGVVEAGSEEAAELVTVARESTDRLIRLINDILDLKKIESGKMDMHFRSLAVDLLIDDCLKSLSAMTEQSGVNIEPILDFRGQVMADKDKATQILTNLISNAVKFSSPGSHVTVQTTETSTGMVRFSVVDEGPGISAADQAKLFGKFQQLDSSDTRQKGGSGLGLAISKALVKEMGGDIGMESTLGQGCTFWFELARVAAAVDTASSDNLDAVSAQETSSRGNKRILLVEDDADLAQVLSVHFRKTAHQSTWAGTLKEARRQLKTESFDVVVLDLTLPDGSGLDLLEKIRSDERTAALPVIVVTGQNIDRRIAAEAAVAGWLPKPFDTKELVQVIDKVTATESVRAVMVSDCDTGAREAVGNELKALGLQCIDDLDELKMLTRQNSEIFPVIVYLSRDLTSEEKESLRQSNAIDYDRNKNTRADLLDAVSELIGGICK
ncbi:MAG: PAS domain S-box protein [Cyanobacteria bacterium SZAS LIN-3]|nr:PAS domain S-box protein [Cyanobacteria bacterium SZAS LIN-3]